MPMEFTFYENVCIMGGAPRMELAFLENADPYVLHRSVPSLYSYKYLCEYTQIRNSVHYYTTSSAQNCNLMQS